MAASTKVLVLTGCIFGFFLLLFLGQNSYYSSALKSADASESVEVRGVSFDVRGGVVFLNGAAVSNSAALRLAYAKAIVRREPFFALAGSDPKALTSALQTLKDIERLHEASDPESGAYIAASYPIASMVALSELEGARLQFVLSGSDTDYAHYVAKLHEAIALYIHDVRAFKDAFMHVVPEHVSGYVTERNIVERKDILTALLKLEHMASYIERKEERRETCIQGIIILCDARDLAIASVTETATALPTQDELGLANMVRNVYQVPKAAPTIVLGDSTCVRNTKPALFSNGMYIGDIRFVQSKTHSAIPFYKYFNDLGIAYVPSSPLTSYSCPEIMSDVGLSAAVEHVREAQRSSAPVYSQSDAVSYVSALPTSDPIKAELALQMHNHSAGMEELVASTARIIQHRVVLPVDPNLREALRIDLVTHFYPRSPVLMYFFASVVMPDAEFFSVALPAEKEPYVWLSDMNDHVQEMLRDARFYFDFHV